MWIKYCRIFSSLILSFLVFFGSISSAFASDDLQYAEYIGSGYIVGSSSLGRVEVYVPIDTADKWGTTSNGYLCNISSSSISGLLVSADGTNYYFRCPSFDTPEIRSYSSSSYNYTDIFITVSDSNLNIATEFPSASPWRIYYPLIIIGLLGVIILCTMRSRN